MRRLRLDSGFTFVELLVALAIMVMIAATVVPVMVGALDRARVERAAESLEALEDAIVAFEDDVNDWPSQLTQLTFTITTGMDDSCGNNFSSGDVNNWEGPYVTRIIPATGLPVFIGTADNDIGRISTGGNTAVLYLEIPSVTQDDAVELDRQVDAGDGMGSGTIYWLPPSNGLTTVYHAFAVSGC